MLEVGRCKYCDKQLIGDIKHFRYYKRLRVFENGRFVQKTFCSQECKKKYEDQFVVEEYRGHKIYFFHGKYMPYLESWYYFKTIEGCRKRIDDALKGIAVCNTEALREMMRG